MQQSWISYFSNLVKQYGGINLAQGIPGFQPPSDLQGILKEKANETIHQYAPGLGDLQLREEISKTYKNKIHNDFQLMVTNGGTEAIHLLYLYLHGLYSSQLKAASFAPVYESYKNLPQIHGDRFESIDINSTKLTRDIKGFFSRYKPDIFFVNTPGNPYGRSLSKEEFDTLLEQANIYNTFVLIDAVYDKFSFTENEPYYPYDKLNEKTFYINSFSKQYSITGWRIGYFYAHSMHFDKISHIHDYTGLCCPSVLQSALANFLKNSPQAISYIKDTRDILKENFELTKQRLTNQNFIIPETHGGYFVWAQLPGNITNSVNFAKELYSTTKTAVIPGSHFGENFSNYIRINIARDKSELLEGLENIIMFSANYKTS